MIRQLSILFLTVLLATGTNVKPRDLIDEAQDQLEQLKETVQSSIQAAITKIEGLYMLFLAYGDNSSELGYYAITQVRLDATARLNVIKNLGYNAGVDISPCVDIREQVLSRLPQTYADEMMACVNSRNQEADKMFRDGMYFVQVSINKVHELDFQLGQCAAGSIVCISPVISQIGVAMVELPQNVETEVNRASDSAEVLKISVQECSDSKVAEFASEANSILADVAACVDRILS